MRLTRSVLALALLATTALGASGCHAENTAPPPDAGPVQLVVESGNRQRITAHRDSLTAPLVGQLVRTTHGVAFRVDEPPTVAGWVRHSLAVVADALAPRVAYAQTVVTGSPIVGAVVCAEPVDTLRPLTAFSRCTNTDATGHATFWFRAGSRAGEARAAINGDTMTLAGTRVPVTFDTARATVLPDTAFNIFLAATPAHPDTPNDLGVVAAGAVVDLGQYVDHVNDRWGNAVPDWTASAAFTSDSVDVRKPLPAPPALVPLVGRTVVVPPGARTLFVKIGVGLQWFTLRTAS